MQRYDDTFESQAHSNFQSQEQIDMLVNPRILNMNVCISKLGSLILHEFSRSLPISLFVLKIKGQK